MTSPPLTKTELCGSLRNQKREQVVRKPSKGRGIIEKMSRLKVDVLGEDKSLVTNGVDLKVYH